jgi:hypothetical protein
MLIWFEIFELLSFRVSNVLKPGLQRDVHNRPETHAGSQLIA